MVETLRRMYRYQDWAMEQVWPGLDGLTAEELDAPGCSGNGTIRGTLTHLIRVQNGWFSWFDGTTSAADAQSMRRKDPDFRTMADARAAWREASDRAEACVAKASDADVAKEVPYGGDVAAYVSLSGLGDGAGVAGVGWFDGGGVGYAGVQRQRHDPGNADAPDSRAERMV